jgi:SAM-dependent methyltransferase
MREFLPTIVESILDIGCGLAGIDILLSKHYNQPELFLLDNSEVSEKVVYGYDRCREYYSSFEATEALLKANYIKNYNLIDIKSNSLPMFEKIDFVISLLSCGYHYPVTEYLGYIKTILSETGSLIIDIREDTDGIHIVKKLFPEIREISHYNKSIRICARHK